MDWVCVMLTGEKSRSALCFGADGDGCKVVGVGNESEEHGDFIVHPHFSVNIAYVSFYGAMTYVQFQGNIFVSQALTGKFSYLQFS